MCRTARTWINVKFVAPIRDRNQLGSRILMRFVERVKSDPDIKLAWRCIRQV